jgi:hypothetical protein
MEVVMSHLLVITQHCTNPLHFSFGLHQVSNSVLWCNHCRTSCNFAIRVTFSMPRERGRPRRGPAWYSLAARQRRQQRLERALSIARTQRIQTTRRGGMAWSPPMAYVEEVTPEEPIQIPPESLLFTVPENWQPPSSFPVEDTKPATTAHHDTNTMEAKMEEFHICFVEEEFSEELLHMASQDATLSAGYDPSRATVREGDPGKEEGAQGWSATTEHKEGAEDGMQAATGEVVEGRVARRRKVARSLRHLLSRLYQNSGVPPHPSSTRTIGFSVRPEKPDGRPGLPWHTHAPTHRYVV